MTVHLRVKGWLTAGAVVPCSPEAMADLVMEARRMSIENAHLSLHSAALADLVKTINEHGTAGDAFVDSYRAGVAALKVE